MRFGEASGTSSLIFRVVSLQHSAPLIPPHFCDKIGKRYGDAWFTPCSE